MSEQSSPERSDAQPAMASEYARSVPNACTNNYYCRAVITNLMIFKANVSVLKIMIIFFHHFNFTVMMKSTGSADWTSVLYFAKVKEIFRRKIYFCSPLEPDENGMENPYQKSTLSLVHMTGSPDTVFPYMYDDDSSDESLPVKLHDEADEEYIFEDEL
ncbi:hypothetical protein EJB05_13970, partial [Eragrostis curvula]